MPKHKIIFEGAELSGKSWLMSQVYDVLEPKYNSGGKILDGCHWFNCDVGLFGTKYGPATLSKYLDLLNILSDAHVMLEKFHFSEAVYQKLYKQTIFDFSSLEEELKKLEAKIILVTLPDDLELINQRIADRLRLYPHYQRIVQPAEFYLAQQREYLDLIKKSQLECLLVETRILPDESKVQEILEFLGEK